jgi:CBS domain-containing protein
MKNWKDALIGPATTLIKVMRMLDDVALQIAIIVDEDGCLLGTVTDGDLRRGLLSGRALDSTVDLVMNTAPVISLANDEREDIIDVMQTRDLQTHGEKNCGYYAGLHTWSTS